VRHPINQFLTPESGCFDLLIDQSVFALSRPVHTITFFACFDARSRSFDEVRSTDPAAAPITAALFAYAQVQ